MKLHPRVTQSAVDLVKRFEGFRPRAARIPDGRFTIGYGHILSPRDSAEQAEISEAEAEFLLRHDLSRVAQAIEESVLAPVNDNQFAALLSFAFNIGVDNFKGSSALKRLNEGAYLQAAAALELWRRAEFDGDSLVVDQLVRRRAVEKALFLAPPEGFTPAPSAVLRPAFDHSVIGAAVAWAAARERTAVSRIALEGGMTASELAVPPGREGEPAPSAAIAAADALAVRLSRILPEDAAGEAEPEATEAAPEPLTLESEPAEPAYPALDEAAPAPAEPPHNPFAPLGARPPSALSFAATPSRALGADAPLPLDAVQPAVDAPPPPAPTSDDAAFALPPPPAPFMGASDATPLVASPEPPPVADAPVAADPAPEPPPLAEPEAEPVSTVFSARRRRFGPRVAAPVAFTPSMAFGGAAPPEPSVPPPEAAFDAPPLAAPEPIFAPPPEPSLFDPKPARFRDEVFDTPAAAAETPKEPTTSDAAPRAETPLFERPLFFAAIGLVGVALFAGSIFCMFNRASFGCLLIGVVGILAMAPAAAFFLFRFLGAPVDPAAPEHAAALEAMQPETEEPSPVAVQPESEDAFSSAGWR